MRTYNIMVIDDTYSTREHMYRDFLEKTYEGVDISYNLFSIEYAYDLKRILDKHQNQIDAFFLDAVLVEHGWGSSGYTFETILHELGKRYGDTCVPPIFMLSSRWLVEEELLATVNRRFSHFYYPLRPCRYYTQSEIDNIILTASTKNTKGELQMSPLCDEREFIEHVIHKSRNSRYRCEQSVDVVLQLAVPDEKQKAYQVFGINQQGDKYLSQYNLTYQIVAVEKDGKTYQIAVVTQSTMGMTDASRTATAALLAFRPKLIVMTGICAGFKKKTKLGDLVVAMYTFDYSFGKLFEGNIMEYRPHPKNIDYRLTNFVNSNLVNQNQRIFADINEQFVGDDLPIGKIHFTSMGSGPWVVDNPNVFEEIRDHVWGNCISLDMEAHGVAAAADQLGTPWLVMKSVQDYADGKKSETEKSSRAYAAFSSTYILKKYIHKILEYL